MGRTLLVFSRHGGDRFYSKRSGFMAARCGKADGKDRLATISDGGGTLTLKDGSCKTLA